MSDDDDYNVGYGRPPKSTQFQKGQSGNPAGRKKAPKSIKAVLQAELDATIVVKENNRSIKVPKQALLIKSLMNSAIKGNPASTKTLLVLMKEHSLGLDPPEPDPASDYKTRKALHRALTIWLDHYENKGVELTEEDAVAMMEEDDASLRQYELPLDMPRDMARQTPLPEYAGLRPWRSAAEAKAAPLSVSQDNDWMY